MPYLCTLVPIQKQKKDKISKMTYLKAPIPAVTWMGIDGSFVDDKVKKDSLKTTTTTASMNQAEQPALGLGDRYVL